MEKGRYAEYRNDEENLICPRFPHLKFDDSAIDGMPIKPVSTYVPEEVVKGVFLGNFYTALNIKCLLELGVTHVLNLSSQEYSKRTHYFNYMTIDVYNN